MPQPTTRYLPWVLEPGDVAAVLERIPGRTPLELRDGAIAQLTSGLRLRSEDVVNLDVGDFDRRSGKLRVPGNRRRTRTLAAGEPARQALERWLDSGRPALVQEAERVEPALFVSKTGRRLSSSDVRRRLALAARRAAVTPLTPATTSTTQTHTRVESKRLRKAYASAHPRA
jgi:site-specific recombinase XerD